MNTILKTIGTIVTGALLTLTPGANKTTSYADQVENTVEQIQVLTQSTEDFYLEEGERAIIKEDGSYTILNNKNEIVGTEADIADVIYTEDLLSNEQLEQYAEQFLLNNFNIELNIPVHFANLEEDVQGGFYYKIDSLEPNKILINTNIITEDSHVIERVLIHELLHYALNVEGKEFKDGQETFENELVKFGSTSNVNGNVGMLISKLETSCCD